MMIGGSETEKNLARSFIGESMARNKYLLFADKARKQGFREVAEVFKFTAENEGQHALRFFNELKKHGSKLTVTVDGDVPPYGVDDTVVNLLNAAKGEEDEYTNLYPHFADIAEREGFPAIAKLYRMITDVEQFHNQRFLKLHNMMKDGTYRKRTKEVRWMCRRCGYIFVGEEPPKVCPICFEHREQFMIEEDAMIH